MIIEAKGNNFYSKLEHNSVGRVGPQVSEIDDIIRWLEGKGYHARASRYSRYFQYIKDFQMKPTGGSADPKKIILMSDLEEMYKKSNDALLEILQIKMVYERFRDVESEGFEERLKHIVSGSDFYTGSSSDTPRDFLYELVVASWLSGLGYRIDFDSADLTDVVGYRGKTVVLIECKRLKSAKKYEDNYRKGCKQLKKVEIETAVKLVFIDIYNCISHMIPLYEYTDVLHIRNTVETAMDRGFMEPYKSITGKIQAEFAPDVDGVVFTSMGNYGINSPSGVSIQLYSGKDFVIQSAISKKREQLIFDAMKPKC